MSNNNQEKLATPRTGHYLFTHTALRQVCETDPRYFFKALVSSDQKIYLTRILEQVNEHCGDNPADFTADDIEISVTRNDAFPLLIFTMPEPRAYDECFNVALILLTDVNKPTGDGPIQFRCFTQELGQTEDGQDCVTFCEWQGEKHQQQGVISSSSVEDFAQAVKHQLTLDQTQG